MKIKILSAAITILAIQSNVTLAEEAGLTLTPSIGHMIFDHDRVLKTNTASGEFEDNDFWSIGVGYRFDNPWQVELVYLDGDTNTKISDQKVSFGALRLDGLFHFAETETLSPYVAFGAGHAEFKEPGYKREESNFNLGAGLKYAFNNTVSLRSDVRAITDFEDDNIDYALTLGLQFLFGKSTAGLNETVAAAPVVVDGDGDNDGVVDSKDQCPNSPNGVQVDSIGCALDDDNDGVPNHADNCPDTEQGAKVKQDGCYEMLKESRNIELQVNFANNSSVIESSYISEISKIADFLKVYPQTTVVIEGYTDSRGSADYNQMLSAKRSKSVASVLVEQFKIDSTRVSSVGYGEAKPVASNDTADGRAKNRRVVAVVSATVEKRAE